jgi:type IV secretory pathway VirB2 component (pilin)
MNIADFLAIGIIGAFLSLIFQYVKGKYAKLWIIVLSIIVGGAYVYFRQTVWWVTIVEVLMAASTVYALFLKTPTPKADEETV